MNSETLSETCPVCASRNSLLYARVFGVRTAKDLVFEYLQCQGCASVFLSRSTPPPEGAYSPEYFQTSLRSSALFQRMQKAWVAFGYWLRLRRAPLFLPQAKILDVGFGSGEWLDFLKQRNFDVYGLDPSPEACQAAAKKGLSNLFEGKLHDHSIPLEIFDGMTAVHCLEHTASPCFFLQDAIRLIKPGGWLGITIPNISSWEAKRARENWYHLDPPYHLCLPSPKGLAGLLEKLGLTEIRQNYPVFDYCQSVLYSCAKKPKLPRLFTLSMMLVAILGNAWLCAQKKSGVIEVWGRRSKL